MMPYILAQTVGGIEIPYTAVTIIFIILATGVGVLSGKGAGISASEISSTIW
jgi:hypothetical protein